ncbi:TetR family transcriptional regulator [Streptomyces sp. NBC_00963]|uniref:TetR/AcrR family transcriptional regulator n=1 Tax=Streptomyces sp. NBC_00963 TaxID=2903697 RepID=UPI00386C9830|nr:TetR family transcriptional regulator [Streptomyces sp. NBC_00963]
MAEKTRPGTTATRQRLLRAAEELFAERGVAATLTREITERAGQGNSSALHYHFGSREGLLNSILSEHQQRVEAALGPALAELVRDAPLAALTRAYVAAEDAELAHDSGRYCLRIVAQLAHETGFRDGAPHRALRDSLLWQLFERVDARLVQDLGVPPDLAKERVESMVMLVGAAFADRARQVQSGRRQAVGGARYCADLTSMLTAMLGAAGDGCFIDEDGAAGPDGEA